jgi:hypothetical protein
MSLREIVTNIPRAFQSGFEPRRFAFRIWYYVVNQCVYVLASETDVADLRAARVSLLDDIVICLQVYAWPPIMFHLRVVKEAGNPINPGQ